MAVRYDQKKKDEVVAFIKKYNEEKGRGGQAAANKKFNINPITIKSWLEKEGVGTPGKGGKKRRKTGPRKKRGRPAAAASASKAASNSVSDNLKRMASIQDEIAKLNAEYEKLRTKI